jgi:Ni,Fe-hydrogenase III large subunit
VEKLFEGKDILEGARISELVSGDASFAGSYAYCRAAEKICGIQVSKETQIFRSLCLELERMYNHAGDIGGIAVDVGFTFPNAYASVIKENILQMNEELTGHRYLKNLNTVGGLGRDLPSLKGFPERIGGLLKDFIELKNMLYENVSFMDRIDMTGVLNKTIAQDIGITGLPGRASGIARDLRADFPDCYSNAAFKTLTQQHGDVASRLAMRVNEFEQSAQLVNTFAELLKNASPAQKSISFNCPGGTALGYCESARGPLLYWLELNAEKKIGRCKIVDPSFRNWTGLAFASIGNIVPDFPLCNKSFNLSYSGTDL